MNPVDTNSDMQVLFNALTRAGAGNAEHRFHALYSGIMQELNHCNLNSSVSLEDFQFKYLSDFPQDTVAFQLLSSLPFLESQNKITDTGNNYEINIKEKIDEIASKYIDPKEERLNNRHIKQLKNGLELVIATQVNHAIAQGSLYPFLCQVLYPDHLLHGKSLKHIAKIFKLQYPEALVAHKFLDSFLDPTNSIAKFAFAESCDETDLTSEKRERDIADYIQNVFLPTMATIPSPSIKQETVTTPQQLPPPEYSSLIKKLTTQLGGVDIQGSGIHTVMYDTPKNRVGAHAVLSSYNELGKLCRSMITDDKNFKAAAQLALAIQKELSSKEMEKVGVCLRYLYDEVRYDPEAVSEGFKTINPWANELFTGVWIGGAKARNKGGKIWNSIISLEEKKREDGMTTTLSIMVKDNFKNDDEAACHFNIIKQNLAEIEKLINLASTDKALLIHCSLGESRSTTTVLLYLIKHKGLSYEEAMAYVKLSHFPTGPNPCFENLLKNEVGSN